MATLAGRALAIAGMLPAIAVAAALASSPAAAGEPTVEQAIADLGSPEWPDRLHAVYALQRAGASAAPAAPALFALLSDDNGLVRFEAAESLERIGAPAAPLLARGLASDDPALRLACARTLARIGLGAASVLPEIRRAAESDDDEEVRDTARLAVAMVAPEGVAGWVRKAAFEVQDEPEGPLWLFAAFVGVSLVAAGWRAARGRRARREIEAQATTVAKAAAWEEREGGADEEGEVEEGAHAEDEEAEDEAATVAGRGARSADGRHDEPPLRGVPHAIAGLVSIAVGLFVAAFFGRNPNLEERHAVYLFASLWMLFGAGFVRYGLVAALDDRRARRRAATATERWLRDREWSRDGTGPIGAERVLPNLLPLLFLIAYLTPFHTIWRLPLSWWGAWIALGVLDLLALVALVVLAGRVWAALRAGRCHLRWSTAPVAPGERLRAQFTSSRTIAATGQATVTLRCLRDGAGAQPGRPDPSPDADELYAEARSFPVHSRPAGGSWIDVDFAIPPDARGTSALSARPVRWILAVSVPTAGPDFATSFPVPVYGSAPRRAPARSTASRT